MMGTAKKPKKSRLAKDREYVSIMTTRQFREWVNTIAKHTGENVPEVLERLGGAFLAECRKIVMEKHRRMAGGEG